MSSNATCLIQKLSVNLKSDITTAKETLKEIGLTVWNQPIADIVLQLMLKAYDDIEKYEEETYFWELFENILSEEKDTAILLGIIDLLLHLESYKKVDEKYLDKLREGLHNIFINSKEASIHYQIFGYLMNFNQYKAMLLQEVEKNKEKYKDLLVTAERIRKTDDFMDFFKEMLIRWCQNKDENIVIYFIMFSRGYVEFIPQISLEIRKYYRNSDNKANINEFFYKILLVNKKYAGEDKDKGALELVLSIYQSQDLLNDMVLQFKNFAQYSEEVATLIGDEYINDLSTEICEATDFVETVGIFREELMQSDFSPEKSGIDLVSILKKKQTPIKKLNIAARKGIVLNFKDMIRVNDIYRMVKNSSVTYSEKIKPNITYNAADMRAFLKLNENNENLVSAIEKFGIHVYCEDFINSEFIGCLFKFPLLRKAAIVVNKRLVGGRLLFTIAHELGHLVEAVSDENGIIHDPLYISYLYDQGEVNSDKFAIELLLPERQVKQVIKKCDLSFELISSVANTYGTSIEATVNRCIDLSMDKYVSIIYENYQKKYFHCNKDHYIAVLNSEIKESIDVDTMAFEIMRNIEAYKNNNITSKVKESTSLWFDKPKNNAKISSQVFVQDIASKRVIVLLQLYNEELGY